MQQSIWKMSGWNLIFYVLSASHVIIQKFETGRKQNECEKGDFK